MLLCSISILIFRVQRSVWVYFDYKFPVSYIPCRIHLRSKVCSVQWEQTSVVSLQNLRVYECVRGDVN